MSENTLFSILSVDADLNHLNLSDPAWQNVPSVTVDRDWKGNFLDKDHPDFPNRFKVSSVWNETSVWFRFECGFERLNIYPEWGEGGPIMNLWDGDVVEVFIRRPGQKSYFEFEVSPLGQWLDVRVFKPREEVDFDWNSNLEVRSILNQEDKSWITTLGIPLVSLSDDPEVIPTAGDAWRVNFFRILGREPQRSYLAWRPTFTDLPDFHIPDAFGNLIFGD